MKTRRLGSTDLELTTIGLGTWAIGGSGWRYGWGPQDDKDSIASIRRAVELGINWIDTAPIYGLGYAEEIIAKALNELSDKPIIATKCGLTWGKKKNIVPKLTQDSIKLEVEASLRRLRVDVIDLYQIHWPNPETRIEEAWETIAALVEKGKVRHAGVSNFNVTQLQRIQHIHPVASLQPPYSMLERGIEGKLFEFCAENDIGIISYSPLQKGILTDKFTRHFIKNLPEDDHRIIEDPNFHEPQLSANLEFVDALRGMARKRNVTVPQLAIAWALRRPEVTAVIVGARSPSQIEETIRADKYTLLDADLDVIDMLLAKRSRTTYS